MSDSDDEPTKKDKTEKRKLNRKVPKLPPRTIIIKNADKDGGWMEKWKKNGKDDPGRIIAPFRCLCLGGVGRGKTMNIKRLFLNHQWGRRKFQKLYIITCTDKAHEYDDLEPTGIMTEMPPLSMFDEKPYKKTCVIIDDFEFERASKETMRRLSTLFRFCSSHRNVSIFVGYQSFFDAPRIARKCCNAYLLYKPNGHMELTQIANRCGMDPENMHYIFEHICNGNYDSLFIDKTIGTPFPLRRNIYEPIELAEEEDED